MEQMDYWSTSNWTEQRDADCKQSINTLNHIKPALFELGFPELFTDESSFLQKQCDCPQLDL